MPQLLELCEKYFQTKDFYEVLNLKRTASDKDSMNFLTKVCTFI